MNEKWAPVSGFENLYFISNNGTLKNTKGYVLKPRQNNQLYLTIILYKNGVKKTKLVHRLVYESFLGATDLQVDHKDGNILNNNIENLQKLSSRSNITKYRQSNSHSSVYTGVIKKNKKWEASIRIGKSHRYLGVHESEVHASNVYQNEILKINSQTT